MFHNLRVNNDGFTLLEIVIAIVIVAILGIGFMGFFANSANIIQSTDIRENALMKAQQEMESLKAEGFSSIKSKIPSNYYENNEIYPYSEISISADKGYPEYIIRSSIEEIETDSLYKLVVTAVWDSKEIILNSFISER